MDKNQINDRVDGALESVDESKRSALRKMVVGAAFAAPAVATFAVSGMMVTSASAYTPTNSN